MVEHNLKLENHFQANNSLQSISQGNPDHLEAAKLSDVSNLIKSDSLEGLHEESNVVNQEQPKDTNPVRN